METMRQALSKLGVWRPRTYSPQKLALVEELLTEKGVKSWEAAPVVRELMSTWTGAGTPDAGEILSAVYRQRREDKASTGDPTAHDADLRLGGHDGHGNRFMNRAELTKELARLRRDYPHAWDAPNPNDNLDVIADRIYRQAVETGLRRGTQ